MNAIGLLAIDYLSGDSIDMAVAMTVTTSSARACTRTTSDFLKGLPSLILAKWRLQPQYNPRGRYLPNWKNGHFARAVLTVPYGVVQNMNVFNACCE